MRPDRLVASAYVWRGARIWFGTRALVSGLFLFAGADAIRLPVASVAQLVLFAVALCFLDTHRRHEWALLGNLAVSRGTLAVVFAMPAIAGELMVWFVAASVR